ncbi:unnamed protein product [Rhizopus stolonifer]
MIVLLGSFPGLHSVYITRVNLIPVPGSTNALIDQLKKLYFTSVPDYFTLSILRVCGNYNNDSSKNVCSPASLGFNYRSSDELLDALATQIPPRFHSELAGIQGGVFIVSVILCFLLLVYYFYHQYSERRTRFGYCRISLCLIFTAITLLFAAATFAVQIYIHNLLQGALNDIKDSFFGSIFSEFVQIVVKIGSSVWLSLVSLILLFLVFILLSVTMCWINRKGEQSRSPGHEMREI